MGLKPINIDKLYELFRNPVYEQRRRVKDNAPMVDRHGRPVMIQTDERRVDGVVAEKINQYMYDPNIVGLVVFENHVMDSTQCGMCSALPFGPDCATLKTAEQAEGTHLNDPPSQRQHATYVHVKAPTRKVIEKGVATKLIHANGHIERLDMKLKPSGQWRIRGAVERNNFGSDVRVYSVDEVLRGEVTGDWRHDNGKQRVFMRDLDHGGRREWVSPPYDVT